MKVLIVDDDPVSMEIVRAIVEEGCHDVETAYDGHQAIKTLREKNDISLVISDWDMPEMNGLDLCRAIRHENLARYIYVILLTARQGSGHLVDGLNAGADEFMNKPASPEELTVRLRTAQRILAMETRNMTIFAMAKLAESRDPETGNHLERVREYARLLAVDLGTQEKFQDTITPSFAALIFQTSPLHDIGKVGIPDHILLKPGRLDKDEFEIMKTHARIGADTIEKVLQRSPEADFLHMARDIAASHHERYDGKGYPDGLAEEQIPLAARIFSVADVYDALVSKRVYKDSYTHEASRDIIVEGRGTQFDPDVVDAFLRCQEKFQANAAEHRDEE